MIYGLYSIYDKVTGVYGEPFVAVNKQTAIRRFQYLMSQSKMVADDCSLYYLGSYNIDTAVIESSVEFVVNSEVSHE